MNELKIQSIVNAVNFQSSIGKSYSTSTFDFKSMLADEIDETKNYEIPADFEKYKAGIDFGPNMHFRFPPDDAPDYFKKAWYEVTSKLDFEERICIFNDDVTTALQNGYYYSMDEEFHRERLDGDYYYNTMNARVKNLGCVGCLELAIRSAEQAYNDNVRGGNEKKWTDKMKRSLDALNEIMEKCKESGDTSINRQIQMADVDFYQSRQKVWREADIWLQQHGGNDLRTMSDEKFKSIIGEDNEKFMKILPDGSILTTILNNDGHIINSFRHKPHALDLLSAI